MPWKKIIFILIVLLLGTAVYWRFFAPRRVTLGHAACRPTGCSGQICSDEDVITTCEFLPEYACYQKSVCERQTDGKCGWRKTPELFACLSEARRP